MLIVAVPNTVEGWQNSGLVGAFLGLGQVVVTVAEDLCTMVT